ncbi:hypothetical protein HDU79_005233 [Rhizoclosmatium sp. JEL0117]|nr:hypothetical protein HDU79_005233 [Rhizoclosmatium sp. JEL0117]
MRDQDSKSVQVENANQTVQSLPQRNSVQLDVPEDQLNKSPIVARYSEQTTSTIDIQDEILNGAVLDYPDGGWQAWAIIGDRYGYPIVIAFGTVLLSLGIFVSSFTTSLPYLICTQGILFGIGASFVYFPSVSLPAQYFLRRRGLAMGVSVSGSAVGGLVFSQLVGKLLETFDRLTRIMGKPECEALDVEGAEVNELDYPHHVWVQEDQENKDSITVRCSEETSSAINVQDEILNIAILNYPDGGWEAWAVIGGAFFANFIIYGTVYSFGVYNSYYLSLKVHDLYDDADPLNSFELKVGSAAQVAILGSLNISIMDLISFIPSFLAERYGYPIVIAFGAFLLSLGVFLSSFTTSLPYLICTQGLLFGIGASFVYFPSVSLPAQYFLRRRGFAMGVSVSGSAVGGLVFSQLAGKLLESIGLAWTLRVTAVICFGLYIN